MDRARITRSAQGQRRSESICPGPCSSPRACTRACGGTGWWAARPGSGAHASPRRTSCVRRSAALIRPTRCGCGCAPPFRAACRSGRRPAAWHAGVRSATGVRRCSTGVRCSTAGVWRCSTGVRRCAAGVRRAATTRRSGVCPATGVWSCAAGQLCCELLRRLQRVIAQPTNVPHNSC